MSDRTLYLQDLREWAAAARNHLDLDDGLPVPLIVDRAGDVASGASRPAASLSPFAAGRAGGRDEDVREAVAQVRTLTATWGIS